MNENQKTPLRENDPAQQSRVVSPEEADLPDTAVEKGYGDFDDYADDYRNIHNSTIQSSGANSDYFSEQKVLEVLPLLEGSLLDLGCGDGNTARFMQKHCPSLDYHGIDVSEKSIEVAKSQLPGLDFLAYDGKQIPFGAAAFDVVFMAVVMHHVEVDGRLALLKEIRRVLRPGGRLIIFEHNPWNPLTQKTVRDCPFDEGVVLVSAPGLKKMLAAAGFSDTKVSYTIFMPRSGLFQMLLPLEKHLKWCPAGGQYYTVSVR